MADKCETCRFARHFAPPEGPRPEVEPIHVLKEREGRTLWQKMFGTRPIERWAEPSCVAWRMQVRLQAIWDERQISAEEMVTCRARPEECKKWKVDWCGLYEAAE